MTALGERQVVVDCDVLQADGGTRTASICGGYLALHDALARVMVGRQLAAHPLHSYCAAISVGIVGGVPVLDLPYVEDSTAEVDMNVVMLRPVAGGEPRFVEVQGTAEGMAFTRGELDELLALAELGLAEIADLQAEMVSVPPAPRRRERRRGMRDGCVCASANPDKVAEIQAILGDVVELLPRPADVPDVVEDADTLEGNARLKAAAIAAATGTAAVADDTGLEVAALGGAPACAPAATPARTRRTPRTGPSCSLPSKGTRDRRARFRTVAMVVWPDGRELAAGGRLRRDDRGCRARRAGLRLRRRVRPRRRRRPHVRRDDRGGEARHVAPRAGVQGAARATRCTVTIKPRWSLPGTSKSTASRTASPSLARAWSRRTNGGCQRNTTCHWSVGHEHDSPRPTAMWASRHPPRRSRRRNSGCHHPALKSPVITAGWSTGRAPSRSRSDNHCVVVVDRALGVHDDDLDRPTGRRDVGDDGVVLGARRDALGDRVPAPQARAAGVPGGQLDAVGVARRRAPRPGGVPRATASAR